jgi:high-affinity nickel permease
VLIAINVLADRFVLRLPVDAVHIAALDNMIRWLMQWKMRLLAVGFF